MHANGSYEFNLGRVANRIKGRLEFIYPPALKPGLEADHNCLSKWKLIFESKKLTIRSKTGMPKGLNLKMPEFFPLLNC